MTKNPPYYKQPFSFQQLEFAFLLSLFSIYCPNSFYLNSNLRHLILFFIVCHNPFRQIRNFDIFYVCVELTLLCVLPWWNIVRSDIETKFYHILSKKILPFLFSNIHWSHLYHAYVPSTPSKTPPFIDNIPDKDCLSR